MSMEKFNGGVEGHAHKALGDRQSTELRGLPKGRLSAKAGRPAGCLLCSWYQAQPVEQFVRRGQRKPLSRLLVLAVFPAQRTTSDDGEVDRKNGLKMR